MAKDKKKASEIAEASEETKSTKKAKKSNGKKEEAQPNVFQKIGKWFRDLKVEFKNVTWPTKQTVLTNTSVVLSVIVIGSAFIGLLDTGLLELVKFLIGLSQK
ncbi:MAG: preprotein translocase subunit SecE [Oscillospiraceae bacterium]|nr:preprotein translocase subunit SecE [Oscillospiraceae bacterium]